MEFAFLPNSLCLHSVWNYCNKKPVLLSRALNLFRIINITYLYAEVNSLEITVRFFQMAPWRALDKTSGLPRSPSCARRNEKERPTKPQRRATKGVAAKPLGEKPLRSLDIVQKRQKKNLNWSIWVRFRFLLAETVGFEPTSPCGLPDFESGPLWPLRYLSTAVLF